MREGELDMYLLGSFYTLLQIEFFVALGWNRFNEF